MPLFYYSRLTEGGRSSAWPRGPRKRRERRSPVEPCSPGWLSDSAAAPCSPLPLHLTNKQWRRWIMRCWPKSKLSRETAHTGNLSSLLAPNKFGFLQMTAVGFADTDCAYEWSWGWGGCGGGTEEVYSLFQVLGWEMCWACTVKTWL